MNNEGKTISVFISYSWDDERHKKWVLNLANRLNDSGIYVILDRFDLNPGDPITHFMENSVNQADKVLLVMTPNYKEKADNRIGGVGYEYSMIIQELYERPENKKIIPIRRNGKYDECAPNFLKQYFSHDMTNDATFETDFDYLLRIIKGEDIRPVSPQPVQSPTNSEYELQEEKLLLYVSLGGTCRDPMAVIITQALMRNQKVNINLNVKGRGLYLTDLEVSNGARSAIKRIYKGDLLSSYKPEEITKEICDKADLILVMSGWELSRLLERYPDAKNKSNVFKEFFGFEGDIDDPFGEGKKIYLNCANEMREIITAGFERLTKALGVENDNVSQ